MSQKIQKMLKSISGLTVILACLVFSVFALMPTTAQAATGINKQINYQGRLLTAAGAVVPDGNYNIEFKIYQDGTGTVAGNPTGTLKWTEDWLNSNTQPVVVKNGYFSVMLGAAADSAALATAVDFNQDTLWLSMNVGNTGSCTITTNFTSNCAGDGEMVPMQRFGAVSQAINSNLLNGQAGSYYQNASNITAGTLGDSYLSSNVVLRAATNTFTSNSTSAFIVQQTGVNNNVLVVDTNTSGGRVGIGMQPATTGSMLQIAGGVQATIASAPAAVAALNGTLVYDTGLGKFQIYEGGVKKTLCNTTDLACSSGSTPTLQVAYGAGATITLNTTNNGVIIKNATADAISSNLFAVQNNAGTTSYFTVGSSGVAVTGTATVSSNIISTAGGIYTGGSAAGNLRVDASGNLSNIVDETTTGNIVHSLAAGKSVSMAATAIPTADLVTIANSAGQEATTSGINALQISWNAKPSTGNTGSASRINVTNKNTTTAGQVQGFRVVATGAGGAVASDTVGIYIDGLASNSTGSIGENAIEIGSNTWDNVLVVNGSSILNNAGVLQNAGLSGTFTNAITLNNASNTFTGGAITGTTITGTTVNGTTGINTGASAGTQRIDASGNLVNVGNITGAGAVVVKPGSNSTTAIQFQPSGSSTALFTVDTSSNDLQVGSEATDTTQVLLQLDSFDTYADTSTCATTTNQGAMYYNTKSNAVRGCVNGSWEDMVSTGSLGLQLFGVVPDSGTSNQGDLAGVTGLANGPCRAYVGASTATIAWNACTAFSGGRKVIVAAGSTGTANATANNFQHLCLTGTNSQPALSTAGTEGANLGTSSMPTPMAPVLCLADIKFTGANNTITQVYDTRTYTTTEKEFATSITTTPVLGQMVVAGTTTPGSIAANTSASQVNLKGVVVATTGATSTNTVNTIIATHGDAAVKSITGTSNAVGNYVQASATAGYGITATTGATTIYAILGTARTAWTGATACAVNSNVCAGSIMVTINIR